MIGAGVSEWALDAAVIVPSSDPNVYTTLAEFQNDAFRFFADPDWSAENWNYPYFADNGGNIDELLINANILLIRVVLLMNCWKMRMMEIVTSSLPVLLGHIMSRLILTNLLFN